MRYLERSSIASEIENVPKMSTCHHDLLPLPLDDTPIKRDERSRSSFLRGTINLHNQIRSHLYVPCQEQHTCARTPFTLCSSVIGGSATPILSANFCPLAVLTHLSPISAYLSSKPKSNEERTQDAQQPPQSRNVQNGSSEQNNLHPLY